jgi:hypothetical protein
MKAGDVFEKTKNMLFRNWKIAAVGTTALLAVAVYDAFVSNRIMEARISGWKNIYSDVIAGEAGHYIWGQNPVVGHTDFVSKTIPSERKGFYTVPSMYGFACYEVTRLPASNGGKAEILFAEGGPELEAAASKNGVHAVLQSGDLGVQRLSMRPMSTVTGSVSPVYEVATVR